ncbi:MAG: phosphoribosylglycinamide formyltransferase [Acholeplasma sp.]|nr:MAG: phosphoribosylglycinamide formyltransferase [Acholeplasma sp.]
MKKIAIFASGTGSNFKKIHENIKQGLLPAHLVYFVSDQPNAPSVMYAKESGIPSFTFDPKDYATKKSYEKEILTRLIQAKVDLIILAGYMRKIGPTLLESYLGKIINIHPSLLPLFKGKEAIKQAWDAKVSETGVTVHFVDEELDHGKIIMQTKIKVNHASLEELTEAVHQVEHQLYTKAIHFILEESDETCTH